MSTPIPDDDTLVDRVDLYPTMARRLAGQADWQVAVSGRIFRRWSNNLRRRLVMQIVRRTFRLTEEEMQSPLFLERMSGFWTVPRTGRRVAVRIGGLDIELRKRSKTSGHFFVPVRVPLADFRTDDGSAEVGVSTLPDLNEPSARAAARLVGPCGPSIITDIDDTIKISGVANRRELFANTFLRQFEAVEGMSEQYMRWSGEGAEFHYVSSTPWQLYQPLAAFLEEAHFPAGSFHLRPFRLRDPSLIQGLFIGKRSKRKAMKLLMKWYPFRQFVLIGDGGELDAELYARMAQKHIHQIAQICIRRVDGPSQDHRVQAVLADIPRGKWRQFSDPAELADLRAIPHVGWHVGHS